MKFSSTELDSTPSPQPKFIDSHNFITPSYCKQALKEFWVFPNLLNYWIVKNWTDNFSNLGYDPMWFLLNFQMAV